MSTEKEFMPELMEDLENALTVLRLRGTVRISFGALRPGSKCVLTYQPYLPDAPVSEQVNADTIRFEGDFSGVMSEIMRAVSENGV